MIGECVTVTGADYPTTLPLCKISERFVGEKSTLLLVDAEPSENAQRKKSKSKKAF